MNVRTQGVRRAGIAVLAGLAVLSMAACGSGSAGGGGDKITVVTSTSVWGSVAQAIGGDSVQVKPIIADPAADPHSYESTPQDAAKISSADLVVVNGGGYDQFMDKNLESVGNGKPVVQAVDAEHARPEAKSEPEHGHGHEVNEHVWYDLPAVRGVADKLAGELGRLQPQNAPKFRAAAERFDADLGALQGRVDQIAAANQGKKVIVTEPVAHYLLEAAKLTDITPKSFVNAVEAETDPPAAAVAEIQTVVDSKQASAVIFNPQTESPVTQQIKTRAQHSHTPVVEMRESLPEGRTYLQWMDEQISGLDAALKQQP